MHGEKYFETFRKKIHTLRDFHCCVKYFLLSKDVRNSSISLYIVLVPYIIISHTFRHCQIKTLQMVAEITLACMCSLCDQS